MFQCQAQSSFYGNLDILAFHNGIKGIHWINNILGSLHGFECIPFMACN